VPKLFSISRYLLPAAKAKMSRARNTSPAGKVRDCGVLLTGLYVGAGTLWLPMVLHALLDLRVAILPSSSPQVALAQPAS